MDAVGISICGLHIVAPTLAVITKEGIKHVLMIMKYLNFSALRNCHLNVFRSMSFSLSYPD